MLPGSKRHRCIIRLHLHHKCLLALEKINGLHFITGFFPFPCINLLVNILYLTEAFETGGGELFLIGAFMRMGTREPEKNMVFVEDLHSRKGIIVSMLAVIVSLAFGFGFFLEFQKCLGPLFLWGIFPRGWSGCFSKQKTSKLKQS